MVWVGRIVEGRAEVMCTLAAVDLLQPAVEAKIVAADGKIRLSVVANNGSLYNKVWSKPAAVLCFFFFFSI